MYPWKAPTEAQMSNSLASRLPSKGVEEAASIDHQQSPEYLANTLQSQSADLFIVFMGPILNIYLNNFFYRVICYWFEHE